MQPSRRKYHFASSVLLVTLLAALPARAETLTITSTPAGANVEIGGTFVGNTPYRTDYPGSFFHKPHTAFSSRLDHSLVLQISMDGYVSQRITLTEGPFEWISINNRHRGNYFLLRSDHFEIRLEPVSHGSRPVETIDNEGPMRPPATGLRADGKAANTQAGTVKVESDPEGAEIYIDGRFVGETPSTLHLASGIHRVELKLANKKEWQRDLEVLEDSQLTLRPALETSP